MLFAPALGEESLEVKAFSMQACGPSDGGVPDSVTFVGVEKRDCQGRGCDGHVAVLICWTLEQASDCCKRVCGRYRCDGRHYRGVRRDTDTLNRNDVIVDLGGI